MQVCDTASMPQRVEARRPTGGSSIAGYRTTYEVRNPRITKHVILAPKWDLTLLVS